MVLENKNIIGFNHRLMVLNLMNWIFNQTFFSADQKEKKNMLGASDRK